MIFGTRCLLLLFCLATLSLLSVKGQDFSEPNTEGWLNPDDVFSISQSQLYTTKESPSIESHEIHPEEKEGGNKEEENKDEKCEKRVERLIEKHHECQKSSFLVDKCSKEGMGENTYLKRFVNKFLDVSALNTGDVQSTNEINLKLYISGDQVKTLRQFAMGEDSKSIPLRKVDEIFTAVLVKPYITLPNLESISNIMSNFKIGSFYVSTVFPALWFSCILMLTRSVKKTFVWFLPVIFLTSFITIASQMYQEAEVEQYKKGELLTDSNLEITAMRVLTKMFGVFIADGMGHFGNGLLIFFSQFKDLGWIESTWKLPLACGMLLALAILFFLLLSGGSIRLPLFMGGFYFTNAGGSGASSSERSTGEVRSSTGADAVLPTNNIHNITFNFNHPSNVQDILPTISQCVPLPSLISNSGQLPAISSGPIGLVRDSMAEGDGPLIGLPNQDQNNESVFKFKAHNDLRGTQRRISKQFHHLQARYKFASSVKRERHLSL